MSTDTVTTFLALLTVVAEVFAVAGAAALAASAAAPDSQFAATVRDIARAAGVQVAFVVAATATAGSLYFSEVANYVPCTLCWYQRIAMYPLPVILAIGLLRRAYDVWTYAVPIALVGATISIYHVYVERSGHETGFCTKSAPCTTIWFEKFGYVTLPVMALSAFAAVIVALLLARPERGV